MVNLQRMLLWFIALLLADGFQCMDQQPNGSKLLDDEGSKTALISVAREYDDSQEEDGVTEEVFHFLPSSTGTFKPTKQWQKIKPGQAIPRGLHVRLNLQTGENEAKLLDGDDVVDASKVVQNDDEQGRLAHMKTAMEEAMHDLKKADEADNVVTETDDLKYWRNEDKEGMLNVKNQHFTRKELKQALKKFKVSRDNVQEAPAEPKKFRLIEDIRKDFESLNIDMKTDLEILKGLLERYRTEELNLDDKRAILADLEYYLHQIHNALNFANMGGLQLLLSDLNSTVEEIRSSAALVFSSAVQSNPKVQVLAIEAGLMQQLIRLLSTDTSLSVRIRSLAALSSLVRNFPYAQRKFVDLGGLQSLSDLLSKQSFNPETEKLRVKAVTLVSDLLNERISVLKDEKNADKFQEERIRQYALVPLLESVIEHGWCHLVPKLLDLPDHDPREKVLNLMWTLKNSCRMEFSSHLTTLKLLKLEYTRLSGQEIEDDDVSYFSTLLQTVDNLIDAISVEKEEL